MLNIVECLLICGHIYNYFGQRCNCALWNVRCDEEISTHFRPIFIPIFARYFHISGQHIFRQNARSAKINVPSFHFYENYLTRCDFFVDLFIERNRQWCPICIKLIGSRDGHAHRKYIMQILRKHVALWRVKFRSRFPFSPFCTLFVVPRISRAKMLARI